jgi:hypothetical protein
MGTRTRGEHTRDGRDHQAVTVAAVLSEAGKQRKRVHDTVVDIARHEARPDVDRKSRPLA